MPSDYPKAWNIVFAKIDGEMWYVRSRRDGGQVPLRRIRVDEWNDIVDELTK